MQKAVISPLKVVISKSIMTHLKAVISTLKAVISTPEGGDQHSEGGDKQKKPSLLGLLSEPKISLEFHYTTPHGTINVDLKYNTFQIIPI